MKNCKSKNSFVTFHLNLKWLKVKMMKDAKIKLVLTLKWKDQSITKSKWYLKKPKSTKWKRRYKFCSDGDALEQLLKLKDEATCMPKAKQIQFANNLPIVRAHNSCVIVSNWEGWHSNWLKATKKHQVYTAFKNDWQEFLSAI